MFTPSDEQDLRSLSGLATPAFVRWEHLIQVLPWGVRKQYTLQGEEEADVIPAFYTAETLMSILTVRLST